ncbi:hypothetical protein A4X13_0g5313 [Tilletia indica]|uniref:Uncharacterized protein n=1 Tax=Tilletia indica TaxID=43049 RepID=A0A177T8L2_9BASI|nr:hypothetical protein A4X13_0g5313 [Tilletia indica]
MTRLLHHRSQITWLFSHSAFPLASPARSAAPLSGLWAAPELSSSPLALTTHQWPTAALHSPEADIITPFPPTMSHHGSSADIIAPQRPPLSTTESFQRSLS